MLSGSPHTAGALPSVPLLPGEKPTQFFPCTSSVPYPLFAACQGVYYAAMANAPVPAGKRW